MYYHILCRRIRIIAILIDMYIVVHGAVMMDQLSRYATICNTVNEATGKLTYLMISRSHQPTANFLYCVGSV